MRYFFDISYKGTEFHGWQIQPNANTVQQEINLALQTIFQNEIETVGSGRTDTGVHAKMQVFHADLASQIDTNSVAQKLNGVLPKGIVVNNIRPVNADTHARFDAISRSYEYHLAFQRSPFAIDEFWFVPKPPEPRIINKACTLLLGEHDFTSFSKVKTDVTHFRCTIFEAKWQQNKEKAVFYISANRFLRGMVRTMVGTLLLLGQGKISFDEFVEILEAKDRKVAGQSVPPQGLYLCDVRYPDTIYLSNDR